MTNAVHDRVGSLLTEALALLDLHKQDVAAIHVCHALDSLDRSVTEPKDPRAAMEGQ